MNEIRVKALVCFALGLFLLAATGCAGKSVQTGMNQKEGVNFPVFNGTKDFFSSLDQVSDISLLHKFDGEPVDTDWIDPAFEEKVRLSVTINNHTVICYKVHSRLGRKAGLTDKDIQDLVELDPADFERREWVALAWARDWALYRGDCPDRELGSEFESLYTEKERRDLMAVVITQDFANRWNNTFTGMVLILPRESMDSRSKP